MFKIIHKEHLNPEICKIVIEARDIVRAAKPGQFIILRVDATGERFPLTIYDFDEDNGLLSVVVQAVGVSTKKLCAMKKDSFIADIAGPLGHAINTKSIGKIICIGGGVGTAEAYPVAKAFKEDGNDVTVIIGARSKDLVICEKEMRDFCDNVHVTTDDGSSGRKGFVTDLLRDLLENDNYDMVFAIGPVIMMKMISEMTRPSALKTLVSLNAIMIDGTGMCGVCRIICDGEAKLTCVDGPEFDGHQVDYEDLIHRLNMYKEQEKISLELYEKDCRIGLGKCKG